MDNDHKPSLIDRLTSFLTQEPLDQGQLLTLLRTAHDRGVIDADALSIIEGALKVGDMRVSDVMVPRSQMRVINLSMPMEEIARYAVSTGHSRFPAIGENKDDVQGILLAKDLLRYFAHQTGSLAALVRPAVFVPETKQLNVLLREFRVSRNHMAIVVDEYGGVAGLVTIEDVLEEIVGEIEDEYDEDEEGDNIRLTAAGGYRVKATTLIEDFNEAFGTTLSDEAFDTVGGLLIHHFGRLPQRGEEMTLGDLRFRVQRADNRRIYAVYVERLPEPAPPDEV